jgi:Flp pilus assembly protein TadG
VNLQTPARRPHVRGSRDPQRGQGMVEFAIIVPVFLLLLMGMLEFGFVFTHNLSLEYATREGARVGSSLSDGGSAATSATCTAIDQDIINAVTKVLKSPGSPILGYPNAVASIKIWEADASGNPVSGTINTWTNKNDGSLTFNPPAVPVWTCLSRSSVLPSDSIGVSLTYTYTMVTPLGAIEKFFGPPGPATLLMTDKTVMSLNPTN